MFVFLSLFQMWPMQTRRQEGFGAIRSSLPLRRCFLLQVTLFSAALFLLTLVCCSSTPVTQSWRSRASLKVKPSWRFHINDVSQSFSGVLDKRALSRRRDHRWMGVLPSSTGRWRHQFRATGILPRQLPGRHRVRPRVIKTYFLPVAGMNSTSAETEQHKL